jgi:hypothetical protein
VDGPIGPPAVDRTGRHLIVTPSVLPPGGGELALIVVNPLDTHLTYGVAGSLDRWDGNGWRPFRRFAGNPDFWGGTGRLFEAAETVAVRGVGVSAPSRGCGGALWVMVGPLDEGFYRFELADALGILQIGAGLTAPAIVRQAGSAASLALAAEVPAATAVPVQVNPIVPTLDDIEARSRALGDLVGPVSIDRLDEGRWTRVLSVQVNSDRVVDRSFRLELPAMPEGVYRISRLSSGLGVLHGVFWVLPHL